MPDSLHLLRHLMGPEWSSDLDSRVYLDWTDIRSARCKPELAWVWHPAATYVPLPASWEHVTATLVARRAVSLDGDWERLHTAPGQVLWATRQLRLSMAESKCDVETRWRALSQFVKEQWPDWFKAFRLAGTPPNATAIQACLVMFEKNAVRLHMVHLAMNLTKWMCNGVERRRVYPLLDAIAYAEQGIPCESALQSRISTDRWWEDLLNDVSGTRQRQHAIRELFSDGDTPDLLLPLESAASRFGALLSRADDDARVPVGELHAVGGRILPLLDDLEEYIHGIQRALGRDLIMALRVATTGDAC